MLDEAGITYVRPKGAFYLFPQVPIDDVEFCRLLQEQKILGLFSEAVVTTRNVSGEEGVSLTRAKQLRMNSISAMAYHESED